jgi:two-component system response regulator MprA
VHNIATSAGTNQAEDDLFLHYHHHRRPWKSSDGEDAVQTRVLVVDDDNELTDLLRIVLEPKGFEVLTSNSGLEGIEMATQLQPDVIVLDLLLPGIDGWQVCREIRSSSAVPILVLSANSKPGMATKALDEGADDYLLKPTPTNILVAHIRKLTRRSHAEQQAKQTKLDYCL